MNALLAIEFVSDAVLWTIAWQSTAWLAAGLALSAIWRRRPARAHVALVACLVAALVSPIFTLAAGAMQWGLLPAHERATIAATVAVPPQVQERRPASAPGAIVSEVAGDAPPPAIVERPIEHVVNTRDSKTAEGTAWLTWSTLLRGLVVAWFAITLVLAARLLQNLLSALLIVRRAEPVRDEELHECLRRAARNLNVTPPRLVRSPACRCPMIWCWGRPALFVPQDAAAKTTLAWEAIFSHELAHLLRRDHLADLCGELVVVLLPWNPLAWLARARMHTLAEEACDDWAVASSGDALDYAESLLTLVPQERTAALAAVTIRSSLGARVQRLLVERIVAPAVGWRFTAAVLSVGVLALGSAALAQRSDALAAADLTSDVTPNSAETEQAEELQLKGLVVDENGRPLAGANVALIGREYRPKRGGELGTSFRDGDSRTLLETVTDGDGRFELSLSKPLEEIERTFLVARAMGKGLAWQRLNSRPLSDEVRLELAAEQPIRGRLIDSDGQVLSGVQLQIIGYSTKVVPPEIFSRDGVGFHGLKLPAAWPAVVTSDDQGRVAFLGVAPQHGVLIEAVATERTAPQHLNLNTGMPEQRGPRDATYRSAVIKNVGPGEEGVFVLAPAQPVGGSVTYEDTGEAVDGGRVTVYSSDQKFGSSTGLGAPISDGRYRTIPYPGIRFDVTAYPPPGTPYLIRRAQFDWENNEKSLKMDIELPRGVLVRGRVINETSGEPIADATIQYRPQGSRDYLNEDELVTGWQAIELSDADGRFSMAVFPGPGRLFVQAPSADYVFHQIGSNEIHSGKPGGERNYAHGIQVLDLPRGGDPVDVTVALTPAAQVTGLVVDPQGQPAAALQLISRLNVHPHETTWRGHVQPIPSGGKFSLAGWKSGESGPISFLDAERKLGATVELGARDAGREIRVALQPLGAATARFVDAEGKPVAGYEPSLHMVVTPGLQEFPPEGNEDELWADTDYVANIDRTNHNGYPAADAEGGMTFSNLIPGASYRLFTFVDGRSRILKDFAVESSKTLELGDVTVPERPKE